VQVALLTKHVEALTVHLQSHKKDNSTRRGLITMVNNRKKLLSYLSRTDNPRYKELIQRLGLRH
jgi:small subunit ribosomal protein S15